MSPNSCGFREKWIVEQSKAVGRVYGTNPDDRADFAQDAALKATEIFTRYGNPDEAFVVRCMHNAVLSVIRRRKTRSKVWAHSLNAKMAGAWCLEGNGLDADPEDDAASPFEAAALSEELRVAERYLDRLTNDERAVFIASATIGLAEFERRSPLSRRRVYDLIKRARSRIAAFLVEERELVAL